MGITEDFWAAVAAASRLPGMAGPYLIGSRLAWAAAQVLGANGAGISVTADEMLRLPWGASDDTASTAERLQFTAGEGPCITAYAEQDAVLADEQVLGLSWPVFAGQLTRHTPIRSVFAAPLHRVGALDLYWTDPAGCTALGVPAASVVAQQILTAMIDDEYLSSLDVQTWRVPSVTRRVEVSVAIGMLTVDLNLSHADALVALRGHAFAQDTTLEEVAASVLTGALRTDQLHT